MNNILNRAEKLPVTDRSDLEWPWSQEITKSIYDPVATWPKISIVTPCFNQGKYIEETIRSVLLQNYPNLEYIIIDGGSKDETIDIIRKYEPWINYWVSEPDRGQSHAINKGLEKCTGEIFNWLNSDDWLEPNALFEIATQFINHPSAKVVSGYENHVNATGLIGCNKGTFLANTLEATIEWCQIAQPSTYFRIDVIKKVGPVPEDMHYIMDGELWVRYLLLYGQNDFHKVETPLVNFRLHDGSKTVNNKIENNFLYERSSIITDLQAFVELPAEITTFWIHQMFKTSKVYKLNRKWQLNENILTKKKLRLHFLRKYINYHFLHKDLSKAKWGIKQLMLNKTFDYFLIKSIVKFGVRVIR